MEYMGKAVIRNIKVKSWGEVVYFDEGVPSENYTNPFLLFFLV